MRKITTLIFLFLSISLFGGVPEVKNLKVERVKHAPHIDGILDDECWINAQEANNFIQNLPEYGKPASQKTIVKTVYDNDAIYIGAYLYDTEPDKIFKQLSERDGIHNVTVDYFAVGLDTYHDKQNAFRFEISAAGVQMDRKMSPNTMDDSWDAVWESKVRIVNDGWIVELKIPYAALRFPKRQAQLWGLQFARYIQRYEEINAWSPVNPKIDGVVNQWGELSGIENIEPPLRLSLSPYVAGSYERIPIYDHQYGHQTGFNGGMDVKWGVNESYTLDMTLIPNFGQIQSDNIIRNLSPFEVQYQERRPFFTEATELFSRGGIFYSRRIGGTPMGHDLVAENLKDHEIIENNPVETQLYNAIKFSGRNSNKLGIGFFNSVTAPEFATIKDTTTGAIRKFQTDVLTNYNVIVIDQLLKNNSNFSFTNANTIRNGNGPYGRDANVSALRCQLRNKSNSYEFRAKTTFTTTHMPEQSSVNGYTAEIVGAKVSGNFTGELGSSIQSSHWDPSDLGIFSGNNLIDNYIYLNYNTYQPKGHFLQTSTSFSTDFNTRYKPFFAYQSTQINMNTWAKFKDNTNINFWVNASPGNSYDYFEPRVDGMKFRNKTDLGCGINYNSDGRKRFAWGMNIRGGNGGFEKNNRFGITTWPYYKFNDRFNMGLVLAYSQINNNVGFATFNGDLPIFGQRNIRIVDNTINMLYAFNPYMNISLHLRHYWLKLLYHKYYDLDAEGIIHQRVDNFGVDENYNAFNIDFVYTWQFAPGSFLNIIWKNAVSTDNNLRADDYFDNFNKTFRTPKSDKLILKLIYYFDWNRLRK